MIKVDFELYQKLTNGKSRRVFKSPKIEWCSMIDGKQNTNRFTKAMFDSIREKSPEIFIKCPWFGSYEFQNLTISKTFLSIMPSGSYNIFLNISDPIYKSKVLFKGEIYLRN